MSLTATDFQEIRTIVREEVRDEVGRQLQPINDRLDSIEGKLKALENDIRDIYEMIADVRKTAITDKNFRKQSVEKRLLTLNAELLAAAKDAGVDLPRD